MARTISGQIFNSMDKLWHNTRLFFYNHKTVFDILFLLLYSVEQIALFLLVLTMKNQTHIIAGIFALLFITTISFEKICMESRYTILKENMLIQNMQLKNVEDKIKNLDYLQERGAKR